MAKKQPWDGEWSIVREMPEGGQGYTYEVQSLDGRETRGVLKKLKNQKKPQRRIRMYREVGSLRELNSLEAEVPALLDDNMSDVDDTSVPLYLVMEYIEGPTVAAFVNERKTIPLDDAIQLFRSLCETLAIGHASNIIHRDIKPANLLVKEADSIRVVVVDYGLSFNSLEEGDAKQDPTQFSEQFKNEFLSIPSTMVPGGNKRDDRIDIVQACGIFYYCLTGNTPGVLRDSQGTAPHRRSGLSVRGAIGEDTRLDQLEAFFDTAFELNIADGFQTVKELQHRLAMISNSASQGTVENPVDVARALEKRLLESDRKSQLLSFIPHANECARVLQQHFMSMDAEIKAFDIRPATFSAKNCHPHAYPDGIDSIHSHCVQVSVILTAHEIQRQAHFVVGCQGQQLVLLRIECEGSPEKIIHNMPVKVDELIWSPGKNEFDSDSITRAANQWLNAAMNALASGVR